MAQHAPQPGARDGPEQPHPGLIWRSIKGSFTRSIGDIIFGMEDGAVSVFGVVLGVAVSVNSSETALLAGAVGAVVGAIPMLAGAYMQTAARKGQVAAAVAKEREEYERRPQWELQSMKRQMASVGLGPDVTAAILRDLHQHPGDLVKFMAALETDLGRSYHQSPVLHGIWMFLANIFAGGVPLVPFALLPLGQARIVATLVTGILLLLLGVVRARVEHRNVVGLVLETLGVAAVAAFGGVVIGKLIEGM